MLYGTHCCYCVLPFQELVPLLLLLCIAFSGVGTIVAIVVHCLFRSCDPEPNPPSYDEDIIRVTLDYLTQSFSGNTRSLVAVLAKTSVSHTKLLLYLTCILFLLHSSAETLGLPYW